MKKGGKRVFIAAAIVLGVLSLLVLSSLGSNTFAGNTALIKVRGIITTEAQGTFGAETASASAIAANIHKADSNPAIKAIVIDINSPGGTAVASEELAAAIRGAEKPVVSVIRDIGTSGAYWAASSSDYIVASPLSITGSVGATASYLEFSGLFEEYGIGYQRIVSGNLKDTGTPFRNLTTEEELLFQGIIDETAAYFSASVQESRQLDDEAIQHISSGRIFTGQQALELGLIDGLGSTDAAKAAAKDLAGIDEVRFVEYTVERPFSLASILSKQASIEEFLGMLLLSQQSPISLQ